MCNLKTFIRWSGNKSKHLRHILCYIPEEYNTYIEPFVGSGALFLKLQPEKWILNDINKDLINVWKTVKKDPEYIISEFKKFGTKFKKLSKDAKKEYCREVTENIDSLKFNEDRAITYLLMKFCVYMGSIFVNNKFYFRGLDFDIYKKDQYCFLSDNSLNNILNVSEFLNESKGKLFNKEYEQILEKAKKGDFVFLDPPYVEEHDYQFNYNKDENLDSKFLKKLSKELKKLDSRGVMWMMTQANTKEVRNMFEDYTIKKFPVYRNLNKQYKNELIIMNYEP